MRWRNVMPVVLLMAGMAHAEEPQEKLDATLKSLASVKEDAAAIKEKLEATRKESERLQQSATVLAEQLQNSEQRVSGEESRYGDLSDQLATKQREFDARTSMYAETIASMLRMRSIPPTAILANPEDMRELLRTAGVLEEVNAALVARAEQLKGEMAALKSLKSTVAKSKDSLSRERTTLEQAQKKLAAELAERQKVQQMLLKDHAAAIAKMAELSRQSQSLQELITKLEKSRNRMEVASQTSLQHLPPPSAKGSWKLPVAGNVIHRFGERRNANETWRGLLLGARSGGTVVAPSPGEVVFTGPFRDYGRMLLIKHKDRRITLLAGLGSISVALNQQVARGEPVGAMDNTGRPELYLELREDGKPVDPADWYANLAANP